MSLTRELETIARLGPSDKLRVLPDGRLASEPAYTGRAALRLLRGDGRAQTLCAVHALVAELAARTVEPTPETRDAADRAAASLERLGGSYGDDGDADAKTRFENAAHAMRHVAPKVRHFGTQTPVGFGTTHLLLSGVRLPRILAAVADTVQP